MLNRNKIVGNIGENIACKYLKSKKYKIIDKNYSCKLGEIDIVAKYKRCYVFVEVKTRTQSDFGAPSEAVDLKKQQNIIKTSIVYLGGKIDNTVIRYDVIEIYYKDDSYEINHIENAFEGGAFC